MGGTAEPTWIKTSSFLLLAHFSLAINHTSYITMDPETNDSNDQAINVDDVSETVEDLSLSNTVEMGNEDKIEIEPTPRDEKDDGFQDGKGLENPPTPETEKDDQQNDEGIEEDDKDESESRKDDTYSDSLIDNVESFTSIDESKSSATALVETPPTLQLLEPQRSSVSPSSAEGSSSRTSLNKKGKRKSNDVSIELSYS